MRVDTIGRVVGVVLTGGKSSRMGKDKASICVEGESFLNKAINVLASINLESIVVGGSKQSRDHKGSKVRYIEDNYPSLGPVAGIHSALDYVLKELDKEPVCGLLIIPIDMPNLTGHLLKDLMLEGQGTGRASYYKVDGQQQYFPLYLPVHKSFAQLIEHVLSQAPQVDRCNRVKHRMLSLKGLLGVAKANVIITENDRAFINIITPDDLKHFNSLKNSG